jgi:hypothetical protein
MKLRLYYVLAAALLLSACAQPTRRSPALSKSTDDAAPPAKPSLLSRTADSTWNVVSAPARWVAPKHAAPSDPETFEPADAYISVPTDTPPDTQPH